MAATDNARRPSLIALTAAAMALPAIATAAGPVDSPQLSLRTSSYDEEPLAANKLAGGDQERYHINTNELNFVTGFGDHIEMGFDVVNEVMSGASPWFVVPDANMQPVQVMSGATIKESRRDYLLTGTYFFQDARAALSLGYSKEDDYVAKNIGVEGQVDINDQHTTLTAGAGFSSDRIQPVDTDIFVTRRERGHKHSTTLYGSVSQIINKSTIVQGGLEYTHREGFLSDPYKMVLVNSLLLQDKRPEERDQFVAYGRLRHFVGPMNAAVHLDYRYYGDSWDISSHTLEGRWVQSFGSDLRVTPSIRYYSQTNAEFYRPFFTFTPADGNWSSDYRLSEYGALSARLDIEKQFANIRFNLAWEGYESDSRYALGHSDSASPGLVDFHVLSLGVNISF